MWYPTKKATNKSFDSEGNAYTQRDIDRKRSEAYRDKYQTNPVFFCEGCGGRAQCSAHIVPQSRAKKLGKTELIWHLWAYETQKPIVPQKRRVIMYSMDGKFVKQFDTVNHAARELNKKSTNAIRNAIIGNQTHAYGFIWKMKHDPERASKLLL